MTIAFFWIKKLMRMTTHVIAYQSLKLIAACGKASIFFLKNYMEDILNE